MSKKPANQHVHGHACGHTPVHHRDHIDYLHEGHLEHQDADGKIVGHMIEVSKKNPATCTGGHVCSGHSPSHVHGPDCGHEAVPHGDHIDYLVDGHLHHPHDGHCDNHGPLEIA